MTGEDPVPTSGLIGRAAESAELAAALDRAGGGAAGLVLVGGDAGAGKTHLVSALARAAREQGCTVLVGQCAELGETMPYLPLTDALWAAAHAGTAEAEEVRAAVAARPVLGRLLPDGGGDPGAASELGQQQLFGAVLGLLGELGAERPVLLVLEDLHWADRSTRHLLTFLGRVLQRERVCLVGTYRSDELHRRHPLRPVVAELLRLPNATAVEVPPFGPGETAEYLGELARGSAPVPAEVVERVHRRSEGNPFYAAELYSAESRGDGPGRAGEPAELPSMLADLLLARVERLSDAGRRVVRAAAVAGRRIDDELVRRVSGLDEAAAGEALREVVSHRLLVPSGTGYTFRHALLREAVYADLLPGERTRLHTAFAQLLAEPPEGTRGSAAELAHHSLAAHDVPAAFAASVRAAREAGRLGAPAEAFEHYERALELWEAVPAPEDAAGTDRVRLALAAAEASAAAGEVRRAAQRLRRLLDAADPVDEALGSRIREHLATYLGELDEVGEAIGAAREAVAMLPADPPTVERAEALAIYARLLLFRDDDGEMPALAERAVEDARAAGATGAEANLLVTLGLYREAGEADPGVADVFARARDLAAADGSPLVAGRAAFHYARTKFDRGDLAGAARAAAEGARFMLDNGLGWSTPGSIIRSLRYMIHYTAGDWAEANRLAEEFAVQVVRPHEAQISAYALFTEVAQGGPGAAERLRWITPLLDEDLFLNYLARSLAAEHALWRGDPVTASEHVRNVAATLYGSSVGVLRLAATGLWAQAEIAAGARAGGDGDAARKAAETADDLLARARRAAAHTDDGRPRAWLGLEGHAWLARAEAERRRVDGVLDPDLWRRAADLFTYGHPDGGFVYEVARSRWRLAEALAEHGDRDGAAAQWRPAVAAAERLGAAPLLAALRDLGTRARLGAAAPADATRPPGPLGALTGREREVLKLVAEGHNNREIAAALFISPKTASVHVSNILAKLDVTSRTQAAAVAHREGI
ncbi:helix-turn-helix transcriptional regulator [Actinomadura welshii]